MCVKGSGELTPEQEKYLLENYRTVPGKVMARMWKVPTSRIYLAMAKHNLQSPHPRAVQKMMEKPKKGMFTDKHFAKYCIM